MKKHVLLAVAVVLLCVLMAGTVSATTLTDGTLDSWTIDRTDPSSWSITDGTISFNVAESPTEAFYAWHGKKSSVMNANFTNYWEVESTLTLPEDPENVGVSLWIQVDGINATGIVPNREDQKSVMDWSILGYYEGGWKWFDSWAESDNWKQFSATIPDAESYTLKTVYNDGIITQYINNQQVNSYSLSSHFSKEGFINTLTAPSVLYVNSKSYGTAYTTKWTVPTVKFSEGHAYDSTVGVSTFTDLKSNLESGKYVMLGKAITGKEIPKQAFDSTRIYISSGSPTLDLNGFTLSSSVNEEWDASVLCVSFIKITGGSLTVKDSQRDGKITLTGGKCTGESYAGAGIIFLVDGGTLTIDSGIFDASYANINIQKKSTARINGGTFIANKCCFIVAGDGIDDATLTISDCEATAHDFVVSGNGLNPNVDIDITGGKLTSTNAAAIYLPSAGTVDISGNTEITGSSSIEIRTGTVTISGTVRITANGNNQYADDVSGNGSLDDGSAIVLHKKAGSYAGNIALTLSDSVVVKSDNGAAIRNYVRDNHINTGETVTVTINGDNVRIDGKVAAIENAKYTSESASTSTFIGAFNLQKGYYKAPTYDKVLVGEPSVIYAADHAMSDTPVKDGYYAPITVQKPETPASYDSHTKIVTVSDGTAVSSTTNPKEVTVTPTSSDKVILTLTYENAPTVSPDGKTVTPVSGDEPSNVKAVYNEITVPETSGAVLAKLTLSVTSGTELLDSDNLPTISTEINEDAKTKLQGTATLISMVTVDITKIKSKNPVLTLTFKVPKSWFAGKDLSAVRAYHFDGTKIVDKGAPTITEDGTDYIFTITVTEASPWGLGLKSSSPAPGPGPQPVSSSGDGNMENAFRVLFETSGGSFISPSTGLSYGDKISQPPAPTKDGYTFGGWYTDSACTQEWSFASGINGDMTLYAKWTAASGSTTTTTAKPTTQTTTKPTSAPVSTQSPGGAATTAAPVAGLLFGLLAAGILIRRRD